MKVTSAAFVATVMVSFIFFGCSQKRNDVSAKPESLTAVNIPVNRSGKPDEEQKATKGNSPGSQLMSSSAAVVDGRDSSHYFIRTAEVKFETKNVAASTYQIEDNIRRLGGYVSFTNLTSTVKGSTIIPVTADSSLRTTNYDVQNTMVIRVPNTQLDSALKCLAPLASYLDYRVVKANDVVLELLANKLKQQRIAKHEDRINRATNEKGKKLTEIAEAQEALLNQQEQADNAQIDNLNLIDQVKFSTINVAFYQPETVQHQLVFNEKSITPYQPGFVTQLADAFQFSWGLLESIIVFMVRL